MGQGLGLRDLKASGSRLRVWAVGVSGLSFREKGFIGVSFFGGSPKTCPQEW